MAEPIESFENDLFEESNDETNESDEDSNSFEEDSDDNNDSEEDERHFIALNQSSSIINEYYNLENWTFDEPEQVPAPIHIQHAGGSWKKDIWNQREFKQSTPSTYHAREFQSIFFLNSWYQMIADRTNLYALKQKLKYRWTQTTAEEIKAMHGVLIYMSIKQNSGGIQAYWDEDPWGDSFVKNTFSKIRFKVLMRFFHVVDLETDVLQEDRSDPSQKIKMWFDMCNDRIRDVWELAEWITIDEGMTKGTSKRNPIRQLMPDKPIPAGTKTFIATDAAGISFYNMVYRGRRGLDEPEKKLSLKVIQNILNYIPRTGHRIVADNWYGSYEALEAIKAAGHCSLLMMKRPRKLNIDSPLHKTSALHKMGMIITQKSARGASKTAFMISTNHGYRAKLEFWRDNKVVAILTDIFSSEEGNKQSQIIRRQKGVKNGIQIDCPQSIVLYNKWKSLVDRFNLYRAQCDLFTSPNRWWIRPFFNNIFAQSEIHAWKAAIWLKKRTFTFLECRKELAVELIKEYNVKKRPSPQKQLTPMNSEELVHQLIAITDLSPNPTCFVCKNHSHCGFMCNICKLPCHKKCFPTLNHITK